MKITGDRLTIGLREIREAADKIKSARTTAEKWVEGIVPLVVGKKIFCNRLGRQKGDYKITSIYFDEYFGGVRAHGVKILASGKLGSQSWDIGFVDLTKATEIAP